MKKVITTTGTSILTNCIEEKSGLKNQYDSLKDKPSNEWENQFSRITQLKKSVVDWMSNNSNASAEIKSILKIAEELKDGLEVYLLATDTIVSRMSAESIQEWFEGYKKSSIQVHFSLVTDILQGLQVKNRNDFERIGMINLINRINQIANNGYYWDDCIFNITGGYKALIPYMTILAQVNQVPIYYIFQEDDKQSFELIKIPQIPISIREELFEKYWIQFQKLDNENIVPKSDFDYQYLEETKSCLEIDGDEVVLNPLGAILWKGYTSKFFIFYSPDSVWEEIQKQKDIRRILSTKFYTIRDNKTETKGEHLVYDDGNNPNRIFYFINENNVYIYKTFQEHDAYERFIDTKIDKESILKSSKPKKVEILKN